MIEMDIWGNISEYSDNDKWYKQSFIDNEIIGYEDYLGNYWAKRYGNFPYQKLIPKYDIEYGGLDVLRVKNAIYFKFTHSNNEIIITISNDMFAQARVGKSFLEVGCVDAPYVPIIVRPDIPNDIDFENETKSLSRFYKKNVNKNFYGTVTMPNLGIITV